MSCRGSPTSPVARLSLSELLAALARSAIRAGLAYGLYDLTGSVWWVSATLVGILLATVVTSPWAGYLGDRHDRRRVTIVACCLSAGACLAAAASAGSELAPLLVVSALVVATTDAPILPAGTAMVPDLVDGSSLVRANGTFLSAVSLGLIVGPGVAGGSIAVGGASAVFLVSGVAYALAATAAAGVVVPPQARLSTAALGGRLDGYRVVRMDPFLRRLVMAYMLIMMVALGPVVVAEVVLAEHFSVGPIGYALIIIGWDFGGLVGALAARALPARREPAAVVVGPIMMAAACTIIGLSPAFWPVLVGMLVGGLFNSVALVAEQSMTQRRVEPHLRARVRAATHGCVQGAAMLGLVLAAPWIAALGLVGVYVGAAIVCLAGAAILLPVLRMPMASCRFTPRTCGRSSGSVRSS